jgi:hypothetical protein
VSPTGYTQVVTTSNAAGNIPSNFGIQVGTWRGAFFDVTTTAGHSGYKSICVTYPDSAPNDGFVDGSEEAVEGGIFECDMRLLHKEGSTFQDVTLPAVLMYQNFNVCPFSPPNVCPGSAARCIDRVNNKICAITTSLSPFVTAAQLPPPVPALSPRSVLALGAALALAGVVLLAARRRVG